MSVRWLSCASLLLAVAACSGGTGPDLSKSGGGRENATTGRENPGPGRDSPGPGREAPSAGQEDPGASNVPTNCLDCGQAYQCAFGDNRLTVRLDQGASGCTLSGGDTLLRCDEKIVAEGQVVGDWREDGNGVLTLNVQGATYVCTPTTAQAQGNGG